MLEITPYQSLTHRGKRKYQVLEIQKISNRQHQKPVAIGVLKHILSYHISIWISSANNNKSYNKGVFRNPKKLLLIYGII